MQANRKRRREQIMDSEYYKTLREITVRREERLNAFHFRLGVAATSNNATQEEISAREVLIGSMTRKMEEELKSTLASLLKKEISKAPLRLQCGMEQEPPEVFPATCHYEVMASITSTSMRDCAGAFETKKNHTAFQFKPRVDLVKNAQPHELEQGLDTLRGITQEAEDSLDRMLDEKWKARFS